MIDFVSQHSQMLIWLFTIVSTVFTVREYILVRRRMKRMREDIRKLTTNQFLMMQEIEKMKKHL